MKTKIKEKNEIWKRKRQRKQKKEEEETQQRTSVLSKRERKKISRKGRTRRTESNKKLN